MVCAADFLLYGKKKCPIKQKTWDCDIPDLFYEFKILINLKPYSRSCLR